MNLNLSQTNDSERKITVASTVGASSVAAQVRSCIFKRRFKFLSAALAITSVTGRGSAEYCQKCYGFHIEKG